MRYDADERREQLLEWWLRYAQDEIRRCKSLPELCDCLSRLSDEAEEDGLTLEAVADLEDLPSFGGPGMAPADEEPVSWDNTHILIPAGGGWEIVRRND